MIIDTKNKIGYFDKEDSFNRSGLIEYNFQTQAKKEFPSFKDWKWADISADKKYLALLSDWVVNRGTNKTELVILDTVSGETLFSTKEYLAYSVKFNGDGSKILLDVYNKKPFCIDLRNNTISAQIPKPIRIFMGDFDAKTDSFYAPIEKKKKLFCIFDFKNGCTTMHSLEIAATIQKIQFSTDYKNIYFLADDNTLYCTNRTFDILWKTNFNSTGAAGVWSSEIFHSEDGTLLCLEAAETKTCNWGANFVLDASNGKILKQIDCYKGRGKIKSNYFGTKLLTYNGKTLDIKTGEVSELPEGFNPSKE